MCVCVAPGTRWRAHFASFNVEVYAAFVHWEILPTVAQLSFAIERGLAGNPMDQLQHASSGQTVAVERIYLLALR